MHGITAVLVAALATASVGARAQTSGGDFSIAPVVVAGGGSPIAGEAFQITSTLGQPATSILSGGTFVIVDGFWAPVGAIDIDSIFADGFELH